MTVAQNCKLVQYFTFITSMSDEFSFEEIAPVDWLNDVSGFTDKHLLTLSEVSKDHLIDLELEEQVDANTKVGPKGSKQAKERNKCHAKNYRDRKRTHLQTMKKQLEQLHHENAILKSQKVCRWCNRSFSPNIIASTYTQHQNQQKNRHSCAFHSKDMEIQFQNPNLDKLVRRPKNPKIWIALGILLLVLGVSMHGLNGDKTYISKIEIEKEHVKKWQQQLEQKDKGEYFQIDMRLEESKTAPNSKYEGKDGLSLQFRPSSEVKSQHKQEDKISISRDLLFSIHAELDDIGAYL